MDYTTIDSEKQEDPYGRYAILKGKKKPPRPDVPLAYLPESLKGLNVWVGWKYHWKGGKWTKPPVDIDTGRIAGAMESRVSFSRAAEAYVLGQIEGLGVVLGDIGDGRYLCGLDFDNVRDRASGKLEPWVQGLAERFATYSEISPTGTGLKCMFYSKEKFHSGDSVVQTKDGVHSLETRCEGAYFTITGAVLVGAVPEVMDRTKIALELFPEDRAIEDFDPEDGNIEAVWRSRELVDSILNQHYHGHIPDGWVEISDPVFACKLILEECPNCHCQDRPAVMIRWDGAIRYHCFHARCAKFFWTSFRRLITKARPEDCFVPVDELPGPVVPAQYVPVEDPKFPRELLRPGGMIDKIIDFNLKGAHRRQPVFALAGAIAFVASIVGRKVRTVDGTCPNPYLLTVGPTGCGKDRAREVCKKLAHEAGMTLIAATEGVTSKAGLLASLQIEPSQVLLFDEFGVLLDIAAKDQRGITRSILDILIKLKTSANTSISGDRHAGGRGDITLNRPNACLLGCATPEQLYSALSSSSITDGLLARILVFTTDEDTPVRQKNLSFDVPGDLLDDIRKLWSWPASNLDIGEETDFQNVSIKVFTFSTEARKVQIDFEDKFHSKIVEAGRNPLRALWTRAFENGCQLALIDSCSRGLDYVDSRSVTWGMSVAEFLVRELTKESEDRISDSAYGDMANKVRLFVKETNLKAKEDWVSQRDIYRGLNLKAATTMEILGDLTIRGKLERKTEKAKNGKSVFYYRFSR